MPSILEQAVNNGARTAQLTTIHRQTGGASAIAILAQDIYDDLNGLPAYTAQNSVWDRCLRAAAAAPGNIIVASGLEDAFQHLGRFDPSVHFTNSSVAHAIETRRAALGLRRDELSLNEPLLVDRVEERYREQCEDLRIRVLARNEIVIPLDQPHQPPADRRCLLRDELGKHHAATLRAGYQIKNFTSSEYIAMRGIAVSAREEPDLACTPAYAITCHKAQGGEWPSVAVDIGDARLLLKKRDDGAHDCDRVLNYRRWLYTAITRAKEKLVLIDPQSRFAR